MSLFADWVQDTFGKYTQPRDDEFVVDCPVCGAVNRCYLNPTKQLFYCQKCGKQPDQPNGGTGHSLTKWLEDNFGMSYRTAKALIDNDDAPPAIGEFQDIIANLNRMPEEVVNHNYQELMKEIHEFFKPIGVGNIWVDTFVKDYLVGRGFTLEYARVWRLMFATGGKYANRIILPVYNSQGQLVYFQAGTIYNQEPKYQNPSIKDGMDRNDFVFNLDVAKHFPCVHICEGAYNAMSIGQSAVSLFGKSTSTNQLSQILASVKSDAVFCVCLDFGAESEALEIVKKLVPSHKCSMVLLPDKRDYNDYLKIGGYEAVCEVLLNRVWFDSELDVVNYELSQKTALQNSKAIF